MSPAMSKGAIHVRPVTDYVCEFQTTPDRKRLFLFTRCVDIILQYKTSTIGLHCF